jgi:hypothetical protein
MTKPKKHILTFEQAYDFDLIGICSHHNDYRLAWSINDRLKLRLQKAAENYIVVNKKGEKMSEHSYYEYLEEETHIQYYLIKNKAQGKFLIPEKPSIDYFLFLYENHLLEPDDLLGELREIPSVLGGFIFDPEALGSTEHIVFN